MLVWPPHGLPETAEDLAKPPGRGRIEMWLRGVALPLVPIVYGVRCQRAGGTTILGRHGWTTLTGFAGLALAVALIALGLLMHFHYFWSAHRVLFRYSEPLKLAALAVLAVSLFSGVLAALVFG